jgi:glycosyltransferase involved in cell wall biosynthesis
MLEEMKEFVAENELQNIVYFYGRRPVDEMPKYYKLADACIVSLNAENQTGLTLPAKVQGYMAAGKPIIGMISGSAQEVISDAKCGLCVDSGDVEGLADIMRDFIKNNKQYEVCGENGRTYFVQNFKKDIFMSKLERKLREMEW